MLLASNNHSLPLPVVYSELGRVAGGLGIQSREPPSLILGFVMGLVNPLIYD